MAKQDVALVVLKKDCLEGAVKNLNLSKVNLLAIITDGNDEKFFSLGASKVPLYSPLILKALIKKFTDAYFLISGYENDIGDVLRMQRFLISNGLPKERIINFELSSQISKTWLANLRYIEKHGADFFATGNEYTRDGLNLNYIPRVHVKESDNRGGVILADEHQDLWQSYQTAKYVFAHVKPNTIKFVLIGLSPNAFHCDRTGNFSNYAKNFQYTLAFNLKEETEHDSLLKNFVSTSFKSNFLATNAKQADLNFEAVKDTINLKLSAKGIMSWVDDSQSFTPARLENIQAIRDYMDFCLKNIKILKDYIELCLKNKAKPVGLVFAFSEPARKNYNKELLEFFRTEIHKLEKNYDFTCVDWFNHLGYDCFYDMTHLNLRGTLLNNAVISMRLQMANLIPAENFLDMNYDYFRNLSMTAPKKDYNALMDKVFVESVKKIRRKDKIKVGFILYDSAMWCGDDLYNHFAANERFEVTVLLCLRKDRGNDKNEFVIKDFWRHFEQLKSHNLNVVALDTQESYFPPQDILIYLTPYSKYLLPDLTRFGSILARTLVAYIPYGFNSSLINLANYAVYRVSWKFFFTSRVERDMYAKKNAIGITRGIYSGYPRTDLFFKDDMNFQFEWKMARPDAKKIIWAPHHTIPDTEILHYATFQWNYKFMYEFAKNHPEISWVVKPHPNLVWQTILAKIFPSAEAFEEYMQKWNELPNAQVYTGGYYQAIFATSDGMIHDCGSFIAEYQFVDKPMIFLTRVGEEFNDNGKLILEASYLVDGKDLDGIAETIKKVFIDGNDFKAGERKKVFDKYLNYTKANGMLASEFIYHSLTDDLKKE